MDVKSNMALYRCYKVNTSRFLGAAIVSFFNGTSCVCQQGGVCLRRVVDELKQTNQEDPRRIQPKAQSEQPSMALLQLWVNSVLSGHLNWVWLTGILDLWNLFLRKFVRGQSAKILSLENLALYGIFGPKTASEIISECLTSVPTRNLPPNFLSLLPKTVYLHSSICTLSTQLTCPCLPNALLGG